MKKFRSWDDLEEKMIYSKDQNYDYDFKCDETGNLVCFAKRDTDEPYDMWYQLDNIMQSTEIVDKNNNYVFQGDIVKIWIDNTLQDKYSVIENVYDPHIWLNESDRYYRVNKIEIVGDIYNNPELLGRCQIETR